MKKCGIITFHYIPNFGAILQAFALYKSIHDLGIDVEIIDYRCENLDKRELSSIGSDRLIKKIYQSIFIEPNRKNKIEGCNKFISKYAKTSNEEYRHDKVGKLTQQYSTIVLGSDMIWNEDITNDDETYLGNFLKRHSIIASYAASGLQELNDIWLNTISSCLRNMDYISVREFTAKELLQKYSDKPIHVSLDPTLLIDGNEWGKYIQKPKYENYVLVYFPDKNLIEAAGKFAVTHHLKLLVIDNGLSLQGYKKIWPVTPGEWLGLIYYSSAVFTNSYHGVIFSILFHKLFWSNNNGERQHSLLDCLGLINANLNNDKALQNNINYQVVEQILLEKRKTSLAYLRGVFDVEHDK